jgi:hypothetical protein
MDGGPGGGWGPRLISIIGFNRPFINNQPFKLQV